jgi:AraC family transcriptional regulator
MAAPAETRQHAASVDPRSIDVRAACSDGVELLVRRRPPGKVSLQHGQREHMLMCSVGRPVDGAPVRSVLRTSSGIREWRHCPRGHVTFLPAGYPIDWEWSYASESVHLTILPEFLENIGDQIGQHETRPLELRPVFRELDIGLSRLLNQLRVEIVSSSFGGDLATSSLLTLIGIHVCRWGRSRAGGSTGHNARKATRLSAPEVSRCTELLNSRLDENMSLADLAREFDLSPFHFARMFKRATGFPPHEFQLQLRVRRGQELLRTRRGMSVAEVASELGFADESHFRRHFKRIIGLTPGRYRAQQ